MSNVRHFYLIIPYAKFLSSKEKGLSSKKKGFSSKFLNTNLKYGYFYNGLEGLRVSFGAFPGRTFVTLIFFLIIAKILSSKESGL